jgi:hypothetical protein
VLLLISYGADIYQKILIGRNALDVCRKYQGKIYTYIYIYTYVYIHIHIYVYA